MSKLILIFLALFLSGTSDEIKKEEHLSPETTINNTNQGMLIGEFDPEKLKEEPYANWFNPTYENYTPEPEAMETIKENISDYEIMVFMGTWCHDSKRETPKLLKILDEADYDMDNFKIIGVDYRKSTPDNLQDTYNIIRVPTIIFTKDGKEVNRFVEHSKVSLAQDIANIVSGKDYTNSYAR